MKKKNTNDRILNVFSLNEQECHRFFLYHLQKLAIVYYR